MERLNTLAEDIRHVAGLLAEDVLEPDPNRTDWAGMKVRVDMVRQGMDKVLDGLSGALEEAEEAELKVLVRKRVADVAARAAALLHATGSAEGCRRLLEKAVRLSEDASQRAELEAGLAEPEVFCRFEYAAWLLGKGQLGKADSLLKRVVKDTRQPALKAAGDVVLEQAAAVFSRQDVELELAIDARLAGGHPREKAEQELFKQGKAQQGRP